MIASGRSPLSVRKFTEMIACSDKCIVYNGAGVYDFSNNRFVWTSELNRDELMPLIMNILDKFTDVGVEIWCDDGVIYQLRDGFDNSAREMLEGLRFTNVDINTFAVPDKFFKILISGQAEDISRVLNFCTENQPDSVVSVCSCPIYCEILNKDANKMSAIKALIALDDREAMSIAIGDYYNDMEMIKGADFSAAPKNAADEIKQEADMIVCDCRRGAVAELINYVIKHFMEVS